MARTVLENYLAADGFTLEDAPADLVKARREMLIATGANPDKVIKADESFTCSICGKYIENEYSHNAQPVNDGRCCVLCNGKVVMPARLKEMGVI